MSEAPLEETLRLGDQSVRVRVQGDGPPLLLLNGVAAPLELWHPLIPHLPGMRVIAYDTPGSGGSSPPVTPLSVRGHAQLALTLLDTLGHATVHALGFSFGGMVAQELARLAGPRLDRLVLASTTCGWGGVPGTPSALFAIANPHRYYSRYLFGGVTANRPDHAESSVDHFLQAPHPLDQGLPQSSPPSYLPGFPTSSRGHMYQLWAAVTWSSLLWLHQITQPTLVLTGDADPLVPPINARILHAQLPNARVHVVHGGDHLCLFEQAAGLGPLLTHFLLRPDPLRVP
jgi:pimeloyl-ACP methyl ester carboxylesterase